MATISVNLDDKATQGLQALNSELAHTAEISDHVAVATANLSEEQAHQITVIHEQRAALSQMAVAGVGAFERVATAGLSLGTVLAPIYERQRILNAVTTAYGAASGVVSSALATQAGHWAAVRSASEFAGMTAIKAVTGLGTPILATTVALAGMRQVWSQTGKEIGEDGSITTNLDRIDEAANRLKGSIAAPFVLLKDATVEWLTTPHPLFVAAWKEIDATTTRSANNIVTNMDLVSSAIKGVTVEQERWLAKMEAQREKEKAGFEAIRGVNESRAQQAAAAARAAEVASLKTVADLDREERKIRELAGTQATAGRNAADIAKDLAAELGLIDKQRTALANAEDLKQRQMTSDRKSWELSAAREVTAGYEREYEARNTALKTAYEEQQKIVQQFAAFDRDTRFDAVDETLKTVVAKMKEEGASAADIHHVKLKQIAVETNRKIEAAKTAEEALKATHEGERARMREEAEFNREMEVKKIRDKKEGIKEVEKLQKEAAAKLAQDIKAAGGPSGEDLLKNTDPRQVMKNIQAGRGRAAARDFADEHKDEYNAADAMGKKRLEAQQRAAVKKAEAEAARDFRAGKADPREIAAGQNQAAQQTLGAMQKSGQLSGDVVKSLSEQTRIAAEQQATLGGLQQQVKQIQDYQKKMLGNAQQQRRQAQTGG